VGAGVFWFCGYMPCPLKNFLTCPRMDMRKYHGWYLRDTFLLVGIGEGKKEHETVLSFMLLRTAASFLLLWVEFFLI